MANVKNFVNNVISKMIGRSDLMKICSYIETTFFEEGCDFSFDVIEALKPLFRVIETFSYDGEDFSNPDASYDYEDYADAYIYEIRVSVAVDYSYIKFEYMWYLPQEEYERIEKEYIRGEAEYARSMLRKDKVEGMFWHHSLNAYSEKGMVPADKVENLRKFLTYSPMAELCVTDDTNAIGTYGVGLQGNLTALFSRDVWSVVEEDGTRTISGTREYRVLTGEGDLNIYDGIYREGWLTYGEIKYLWYNDRANEWIAEKVHELALSLGIPCFYVDEDRAWMKERQSLFEPYDMPNITRFCKDVDLSEWY